MGWRTPAAAVTVAIAVLACHASPVLVNGAWVDREAAGSGVGAALADCSSPDVYTSEGRSRFFGATLAGSSLDGVAALSGVTVHASGAQVSATPTSSTSLGDSAYRSGVDAAALGGITLGTSATALPFQFGSLGVYAQIAAAKGSGQSWSATGAVTDSGALAVGGSTTPAQLATVDLDATLVAAGVPLPTGFSGTMLTIGALASRATTDACAPRWGGASSDARTYQVAGAAVRTTSRALAGFDSRLRTASTTLTSAVASIADDAPTTTPAEAAIATSMSTGLQTAVRDALSGLVVGATVSAETSTAALTTAGSGRSQMTTALAARTSDSSGTLSVTPSTGLLSVDLSGLGGVNDQPANTALLGPSRCALLQGRIGNALGAAQSSANAGLAAIGSDVAVTGSASVTVKSAIGAALFRVALTQAGTLGQFDGAGAPNPTITVSALGGSAAIGASLATALAGTLATDYVPAVAATVRREATQPIGQYVLSAQAATATALTAATSASTAEITGLAAAVGLTVNVQPDRAPFPARPVGVPAATTSTTALRVEAPASGGGLVVDLATSAVGPDAPLAAVS